MAKEASGNVFRIGDIAKNVTKAPTVYKADQVEGRAFVCTNVEPKVYDDGGESVFLHVQFVNNGEDAKIQTAAVNIVSVAMYAANSGYLPFTAKIVRKGKYHDLVDA